MSELDLKLIEEDAVKRGLKPQFHFGEKPSYKVETADESIKVWWLGSTSEADWIRSAYQVCIASWTQEPVEATEEEMLRVIKAEKFATVPYETFNATVAISGVSRMITHQIVRHRQFGFFQESLRNTDMRTHTFRLPPHIAESEELAIRWKDFVDRSVQLYVDLVDNYKIPFEEARAMMPMGSCTYIGMTGNLRAWEGYFAGRTQEVAQSEHRVVADLLEKLFSLHVPKVWKVLESRMDKKK